MEQGLAPKNITEELRKLIKSKVLDDFPAITAYSIDASIYKEEPIAIILLENEDDLIKTINYCKNNLIPITSRSGGTNLTGSAVGKGIIIDFSKMNRIIEVNETEKWAIVEPGITLTEFNKELEYYGLMYGPDPSSGDMCKLGGMYANNSAGPHTLKYGAVKDNISEMTVFLENGNKIISKNYKLESPELKKLTEEDQRFNEIIDLIKENKTEILKKRIGVSKNSSGYNLFDLAEEIDNNQIDLNKLFIGSEGTLGIITKAKLPLYDKPKKTVTLQVNFKKLNQIGDGVNELLKLKPSALEIMDSNTMDLVGRKKFSIPKDSQAMLIIEFDEEPIEEKISEVKKLSHKFEFCNKIAVAFDKEEQANLWKARKAIYPTLYNYGKGKKPINFCDDVVVSAEKLPDLLNYLDNTFKDMDVPVAIYGHIGDGNAHINPLLNLSDPKDFNKMVELSNMIHREVIEKFSGSICGEHGDGRVRSEFLRELYGEKIYALFQKTKSILDPDNILNPGIILTDKPFTENIDLERLEKQCATCGKCNSVCPVYDITQDESNSARGWFHIMTDKNYNYNNSQRAVNACINCKSCAGVCPAGIDVSEIALEKRAEHPNKLTGIIFRVQQNEKIFSSLTKFSGLTQPIWDNKISRRIIEKVSSKIMVSISDKARIPKEMKIPKIATKTLREKYKHLTEESGYYNEIAYFHGCAANYLKNGIGDAVINVLNKNGITPALPKQRCSGTPILTYGNKDIALENAKVNIDSLLKYKKIITSCASCNLMIKEYENYFTDGEYHQKTKELKNKIYDISEFLFKEIDLKVPKGFNEAVKVTYHSSCHLRVAGITKEPKNIIRKISGVEFVEMRDSERCAGGAGSFIVKNYEQSKKIFNRKKRGISESKAEVVTTSCPACKIQLEDGLDNKVKVKHVVELLSDAYK